MKHTFFNDRLKIFVDSNLYPESTIYKCFYWYTGDYEVIIEKGLNAEYIISLSQITTKLYPNAIDTLLRKIQKDLIDFKLREIVQKETAMVRQLIIAKAFANFDSTTAPETQISDPVGFKPNEI